MVPIKIFEQKKVRTHWEPKEEQWYFSIIDVVSVLTDTSNPRDYWFKMKVRVKLEDGIELSTICRQFKLLATDGKMRETDCGNTQQLLRIIQSIPSPKAEPFKQWLAKTGYERMQEISDPSQSIDRARENGNNLRFTNDDLRITIPNRTSYLVSLISYLINPISYFGNCTSQTVPRKSQILSPKSYLFDDTPFLILKISNHEYRRIKEQI